ncbi:hypothetical protein [Flavobacterium sp.]|uniref:hypothetical protein n=1 Tax=Flavobacterium sp. TaxID=239 RepID=UPI0039E51C0D
MNRLCLLLLLVFASSSAQDSIITFAGKRFRAEIVSKSTDSIHFKNTERKDKLQQMAKADVSEIKYANGTVENFFTDAEKAMPPDALKAKLLDMIGTYCYEVDSNKLRYKPVYEDDYIRMNIYKGEKLDFFGFLFDFSRVYEFHPVNERNDTDAYLNIVVAFRKNSKKEPWGKQKLVLRVKGHEQAHQILRLLEVYNFKLKHQKK